MVKLVNNLKFRQIFILVKQLSRRDKLRLLKELEQETWSEKLDKTVSRIRDRAQENKITDSDIDKIVEEVRVG
ncbi:MAG: hypothetical protein HY586_07960 [Candidatus Omnitrophica bacterium]|nr:hypothetical protein [Candidatus Omnitrophota bacterium]